MYKAKDGKRFGSIFAGKHYDENHAEDGLHSESPEHEAKETPEFEAGEQEGAVEHKAEGEEPTEVKEGEEHPVVSEHGKAHKVVISHDENTGRHTVTSHHKDGHVHTAVHEHAHKAHAEGKQLAGVVNEKPALEEPAHKQGEEDGFSMPGLD